MNIILVPDKAGGTHACFSHRHLLVIGLVGGVFLPAFLGYVSYQAHDIVRRHGDSGDQMALYAKELARQSHAIGAAKQDAAVHLNALARRMGQLQAQVLRLNALGGRLTRMAGLDHREFNFDTEVAQGGPETGAAAGGVEVAATLEHLSDEIRASETKLHALETLLLDRRLSDAVTPGGWPAEGGFVSSGYGTRADPFTGRVGFHAGIDIAARLGSPIRTMADGVVSYAGEKEGYGKVVEITHESGLVTRYGHISTVVVKVGDKISRGAIIAQVGTSGRSTGPHIHIEVLKDGRAVNPAAYLRASR
jgi:murein DD-endopeptidase MepM/ murein hydrolase activator NlpD